MGTTIKFEIPGEPFGKLNMRPTMIRGHASSYSPSKNNQYMDRIIQIINQNMIFDSDYVFPKGTPVSVMIIAYFKIPDGEYKFYKREGVSRYTATGQAMLDTSDRSFRNKKSGRLLSH